MVIELSLVLISFATRTVFHTKTSSSSAFASALVQTALTASLLAQCPETAFQEEAVCQ